MVGGEPIEGPASPFQVIEDGGFLEIVCKGTSRPAGRPEHRHQECPREEGQDRAPSVHRISPNCTTTISGGTPRRKRRWEVPMPRETTRDLRPSWKKPPM